jgi:hypothetical protein
VQGVSRGSQSIVGSRKETQVLRSSKRRRFWVRSHLHVTNVRHIFFNKSGVDLFGYEICYAAPTNYDMVPNSINFVHFHTSNLILWQMCHLLAFGNGCYPYPLLGRFCRVRFQRIVLQLVWTVWRQVLIYSCRGYHLWT